MNTAGRPLPVADLAEAAQGVACTLPRGALNARLVDLRQVMALATGVAEVEQGFVLSFPATDEAARAACDAVLVERVCCARFRYVVSFAPGDASFSLTVDATGDDVAGLKALYAPLLAAAGHHG